jgi:hypothetical protein
MLKISRTNDSRVVKAILHRIADIPGGVAVKASVLGGPSLMEGTPLSIGTNGLLKVIKTAKVAEAYTSGGPSIKVEKGSHFVAGDKLSDADYTDVAVIASIDKSNAAYDLLTLTANTLSVNLDLGDPIIECFSFINITATHDGVVQGAHSTTTVTQIKVDKGHTFVVGDIIAGTGADPMTGKTITGIDRGDDAWDLITVSAQIGKTLADDEALISVTEVSGTTERTYSVTTVSKLAAAVAIVGSNYDVKTDENMHVDAWVQAVVREANGPILTDAIKSDLKGIIYL